MSGDMREDYQNCFVLYSVTQLCTIISILVSSTGELESFVLVLCACVCVCFLLTRTSVRVSFCVFVCVFSLGCLSLIDLLCVEWDF